MKTTDKIRENINLVKDHIIADAQLSLAVESASDGDCLRTDWTVTNCDAETFRGTVRLIIEAPDTLTNPWIMVPGFIYGENRRKVETQGKSNYPRVDPNVDEPANMCSSWWDFGADRTASPLVYLHQDEQCFAVATAPHHVTTGEVLSDDIEPQVGVGFDLAACPRIVRFSIPACDEPFTYRNSPDHTPTIRRVSVAPGASISGTLYRYQFPGDRHGYQSVLQDFDGRMRQQYQAAPLPEFDSLVTDAIHGVVEGHYLADQNYFQYSRSFDPVAEQIANLKNVSLECHQMMTGFANGLPVCHGLLGASRLVDAPQARETAVRVADRICTEGLSPSGLFWADYVPDMIRTPNGEFANTIYQNRRHWGSGWLSIENAVHSRTIADACDHLAAMILLCQAHDACASSVPGWKQALATNIDTILDLQLANGSYGQYYDADKKTVIKEDGCGGLLWIPALIKACAIPLQDANLCERMKASVTRAGDYYAPYVRDEYIWGAPEDNDSPTSEDGMNAVIAYCDLYEFTGNKEFLDLARIAADWMLTFRKTYNQKLPAQTLIGAYQLRSRGGDFASVSNNCLHVFEVLCTRHLCALSRWTGNDYYRNRARDHWTFACQYLSRCDGMFNGFRGAMSEQFHWTDWGSWGSWHVPTCHHQKGTVTAFSTVWCIAAILLAAADAKREFGEG